jgi:hypothetical protein
MVASLLSIRRKRQGETPLADAIVEGRGAKREAMTLAMTVPARRR